MFCDPGEFTSPVKKFEWLLLQSGLNVILSLSLPNWFTGQAS
jgi:hypothetical protein